MLTEQRCRGWLIFYNLNNMLSLHMSFYLFGRRYWYFNGFNYLNPNLTIMINCFRSDLLQPSTTSGFLSRPDRRTSITSRSGSPVRFDQFRRRSPSRYEDDDDHTGSPSRWDDRTRSPSRSRLGSDAEMRGFTPSPLSRRDTMIAPSVVSPRWGDSLSTSPRASMAFFPDSDPIPPPPPSYMSRRSSMDRRGSDFRPESIEGPAYPMQDFDPQDDGDSLYSGDYGRRDSRF